MAGPLERLEALGRQEARVGPNLRHLEIFTLRGLLTVLWHGEATAPAVVVLGGGAMGGTLGPGDAFYSWLADEVAAPGSGIGVLRVGWRKPNDLDMCTLDMLAVADLASRTGAAQFVTGGHSFGGAIAVRAGVAMSTWTAGVMTFASQSAGCEPGVELTAPLIAFHGDRDELLPLGCSETVCALVGGPAELVVCPDTGHLMSQADGLLKERVPPWLRERFAEHGASRSGA